MTYSSLRDYYRNNIVPCKINGRPSDGETTEAVWLLWTKQRVAPTEKPQKPYNYYEPNRAYVSERRHDDIVKMMTRVTKKEYYDKHKDMINLSHEFKAQAYLCWLR